MGYKQRLQKDIELIDAFKAGNYDYFDYQHFALEKGLMRN
jgi:hypothetical protein